MFIGLAIGAAIGAGFAVRHYCWPWERPVVVERPVYVEKRVVVEDVEPKK